MAEPRSRPEATRSLNNFKTRCCVSVIPLCGVARPFTIALLDLRQKIGYKDQLPDASFEAVYTSADLPLNAMQSGICLPVHNAFAKCRIMLSKSCSPLPLLLAW